MSEELGIDREKEIREASRDYQLSTRPMAIGGDAFADDARKLNVNTSFTACQFIKADVCRGIVDFFVKSDAHIGISVDGKVTLGHVSHWMPLPAIEGIKGNQRKISPNEKGDNE